MLRRGTDYAAWEKQKNLNKDFTDQSFGQIHLKPGLSG